LTISGLLLGSGCTSTFSAAVGPNQDLSLVSDFQERDDHTEALRHLFGKKVHTPLRDERRFKVERTDSTGFRHRKDWRNLIILTDFRDATWGSEAAKRALGVARHQEMGARAAAYAFGADVWADGQTVLFVHAAERDGLLSLLEQEGEALVARFENAVIEGLIKTMYLGGEQTAMVRGIEQRHGYTLRVPEGYTVEEQTENRFVRIKTMQPNGAMLWMFVYYQEKSDETLDPNLAMGIRDTVCEHYYGGDEIDPGRSTVRERTFLQYDALEIHGVYRNLDPPMGGPFKLICFHAGDRLYLIDLAVFNPPGDKTPQLRTLEAIARTFVHSPAARS